MRLYLCDKCHHTSPIKHKGFDGKYRCDTHRKSYVLEGVVVTETPDKNGDVYRVDGIQFRKDVPVRFNFLRNSQASMGFASLRVESGQLLAKIIIDKALAYPEEIISNYYPAIGGVVLKREDGNPWNIQEFKLKEIGLVPTPNHNPDIKPLIVTGYADESRQPIKPTQAPQPMSERKLDSWFQNLTGLFGGKDEGSDK